MLAPLRLSNTTQHLKLSNYHHCCWGQDHPAGSEVGPWFEAQHHVDISAEPLHAWKRERDSEASISPPEPGACTRLPCTDRKWWFASSTAKKSLPSQLGDAGRGPQLVLSEGPGSAPQASLERRMQ